MKAPTTVRVLAVVALTLLLGACASLSTQQGVGSGSLSVRVVNGEHYRVIRADPLYLYEHDRSQLSGKRFATVTDRFFSTTANAPLRPLTLVELKSAYPKNHQFHDILTLAFTNDAELMRWDEVHHEYLVAHLLRQTLAGGTVVSTR